MSDEALQAKLAEIDKDVKSHDVILYMKGNELMAQCGFSARAVQILEAVGAEFVTRDVLKDDVLREAIKVYGNWPTIPQLYVGGELVGGSDIMMEMYQTGDLQEKLIAVGAM
jgi:monothiol glutaredoxin